MAAHGTDRIKSAEPGERIVVPRDFREMSFQWRAAFDATVKARRQKSKFSAANGVHSGGGGDSTQIRHKHGGVGSNISASFSIVSPIQRCVSGCDARRSVPLPVPQLLPLVILNWRGLREMYEFIHLD